MFASLLWLLRFFILYSRASSLFYAWFLLFLSIAKQSFKFWSPVYQFFLLQTLLLSANLVCLDFLLCLSYKFYILSPPSIWSHFCIRTCVKNIYTHTHIYIYIYFFFFFGLWILWMSNSSSTICWKGYLPPLSWLLCKKSVEHIYVGLFLGSLFCPTDLCVFSSTK